MYWNGERKQLRPEHCGIEHVHSGNTTSTIGCGAIVLSVVHSVLLKYGMQLRRSHMYTKHSLGRLPDVEYKEGGCGVKELRYLECGRPGGIVPKSRIDAIENLIAPTRTSGGML